MGAPPRKEDEAFKVLNAAIKPCARCESFLDPPRRTVVVTIEDIENAAAGGCVFCGDLLENVKISHADTSNLRDVELLLKPSLEEFKASLEEFRGGSPPSGTLQLSYLQSSGEILAQAHYSSISESDMVDQTPENLPCFTGSQATMDLMRSWYNSCRSNHDESVSTATWCPKRVLQILSDTRLRLIDTDVLGEPLNGGYACLSHCWGSAKTLSLTKNTKNELFGGLDIDQLPSTFRQALRVTAHLGIEFFWIDRLCIFQDSAEDWEKQGLTMKDVYRNAQVTIAATRAKDSHAGLFHYRDGADRRLIQLPYQPRDDGRRYFLYRGDVQNLLVNEPLVSRAWAFQERILSSRIIHFGNHEVVWECDNTLACESLPKAIPSTTTWIAKIFENTIISEPKSSEMSKFYAAHWTDEIWRHWYGLLVRYIFSDLSYESDRLIAFAGVVQMIIERASSYTYHAGIWVDYNFGSVVAQLLWSVPSDASPRTDSVVPTWSPFFYKKLGLGYYHLTPAQESLLLVSIRGVQVQLKDPNQPAGHVISGKIETSGIMRRATFSVGGSGVRADGIYIDGIFIRVDMEDTHKAKGTLRAFLVPFVLVPKETIVYGLLLRQTATDSEFQRVGMWYCHTDGHHRSLALGQLSTTQHPRIEHVTNGQDNHPPVSSKNDVVRRSQEYLRQEKKKLHWEDVQPIVFTIV